MNLFIELTFIIFIATAIAIFLRFFKQPLIVGYILAGIAAGPYGLNAIHSKAEIELFSKIGIIVLLFIVGLNLNPKVIKEVGKASFFLGVGQILSTGVIGLFLARLMGIGLVPSLYLAIAFTFSSTIIVLKLLSDRGDLHKLYGKISIGLLLVQDIVATVVLLFVSSLSHPGNETVVHLVSVLLLKALWTGVVLYLVATYFMPRISKFMASSSELLFLFSLTWGLGLASLFYVFGFSAEIGALTAGVILSVTPFAYEIAARLKPLRDFFIVIFFVLLGSQMVLGNMYTLIFPALIFSAFVLFGHPVIVFVLMNLLGYKRRTGFMAGLTTAQISEFSLILASVGFSLGHLTGETLSLITFVGLITIAGSTYSLLYADKIYPRVENVLRLLELRDVKRNLQGSTDEKYDIMLFGYDRIGHDFVSTFTKMGNSFLVIDFNPICIQHLEWANLPHRFGDAEDIEFLQELNLEKVKMIVSTIPDFKTNIVLTKTIKQANANAIVIVLSHDYQQAHELYSHGATYVVIPHYLGAHHTAKLISRLELDTEAFNEEREKHIDYLNKRRSLTVV